MPGTLQQLLRAREVVDALDRTLPHHHLGGAGEHRRHEVGDRGAAVLVVGVGVDDHVGAEPQPCVEAGGERGRQPAIAIVARSRDRRRATCATSTVRSLLPSSITSHSTTSKPVDLTGQVGHRLRQRRFLVEARDLDDQLHRSGHRAAIVPSPTAEHSRASDERRAEPPRARSTAIVTKRLVTATDSARVAPIGPVISATNTLSRTPIPPGTPMTTNPTIHDSADSEHEVDGEAEIQVARRTAVERDEHADVHDSEHQPDRNVTKRVDRTTSDGSGSSSAPAADRGRGAGRGSARRCGDDQRCRARRRGRRRAAPR